MKAAWVVVLAAGVGRASAAPACEAKLGKDHAVVVAGKPTGLTVEMEPDKEVPVSFVTYPLDATHILLAWAMPGHYGRPVGSDLYVVDCKAPAKPKVFASGDFGHSELLPDGKRIVFSDGERRGIGVLDVATKKARGLTYPPAFKDETECDGREPGLHDVVVDLDVDNDLLEFQRGGSCGFEGDWESTRCFIEHVTTKPGKPRRGYPIDVIAAGAGNDVWAAGPACDGRATAIAWSSTDLGAKWTAHKIPRAASGVIAMFVDAKQAGHVSVVTGACVEGPDGSKMPAPDRVHVTRDGGATWQLAKLPTSTQSAPLVPEVISVDGSYDHLALWGRTADSDSDTEQAWTSGDAGATWKPATKPPKRVPPPSIVEVTGVKLSTSTDGIVVRRATGPTTRVYPYR